MDSPGHLIEDNKLSITTYPHLYVKWCFLLLLLLFSCYFRGVYHRRYIICSAIGRSGTSWLMIKYSLLLWGRRCPPCFLFNRLSSISPVGPPLLSFIHCISYVCISLSRPNFFSLYLTFALYRIYIWIPISVFLSVTPYLCLHFDFDFEMLLAFLLIFSLGKYIQFHAVLLWVFSIFVSFWKWLSYNFPLSVSANILQLCN